MAGARLPPAHHAHVLRPVDGGPTERARIGHLMNNDDSTVTVGYVTLYALFQRL